MTAKHSVSSELFVSLPLLSAICAVFVFESWTRVSRAHFSWVWLKAWQLSNEDEMGVQHKPPEISLVCQVDFIRGRLYRTLISAAEWTVNWSNPAEERDAVTLGGDFKRLSSTVLVGHILSHINKPGWPGHGGLNRILCNRRCCNQAHLWCALKVEERCLQRAEPMDCGYVMFHILGPFLNSFLTTEAIFHHLWHNASQ